MAQRLRLVRKQNTSECDWSTAYFTLSSPWVRHTGFTLGTSRVGAPVKSQCACVETETMQSSLVCIVPTGVHRDAGEVQHGLPIEMCGAFIARSVAQITKPTYLESALTYNDK